MIMDYKVSAIVILYELEKNGEVTYTKQTLLIQESCYQYWSSSDVPEFAIKINLGNLK